jgi:predicted secreted Zn-dependent protease
MPEEQLTHSKVVWRTALNCDGGACIRVAASGSTILIADTKTPAGPVLSYTKAEFQEFIAGVKNGDFDDFV